MFSPSKNITLSMNVENNTFNATQSLDQLQNLYVKLIAIIKAELDHEKAIIINADIDFLLKIIISPSNLLKQSLIIRNPDEMKAINRFKEDLAQENIDLLLIKIEENIPLGATRDKVANCLLQLKENYKSSKNACIEFINSTDLAYQDFNKSYRFSKELHNALTEDLTKRPYYN